MKTYQYLNAENTIVAVFDEDGISRSSCLASILPPDTVIAPYIAPPVVLPAVSPRQIRQALTLAGLRASVEAAVAAGDQNTTDWYEYSTSFERLNPQVTAMGIALAQTDKQLDDLWILGATL